MNDYKLAMLQAVLPTALSLVALAATASFGFLCKYLLHKAQGAKQQLLLNGLSVLAQAADNAVIQIEQNIRPTVSTIAATGKVTPEAAAALKAAAIAAVEDQAKTALAQILQLSGVDTATVIPGFVENAAAKLAGNTRAASGQEQMMRAALVKQ